LFASSSAQKTIRTISFKSRKYFPRISVLQWRTTDIYLVRYWLKTDLWLSHLQIDSSTAGIEKFFILGTCFRHDFERVNLSQHHNDLFDLESLKVLLSGISRWFDLISTGMGGG
jgi:hypothetical protein